MFFPFTFCSRALRPVVILVLGLAGLLAAPVPLHGQEEASRLFFKADYLVRQAEHNRRAGQTAQAVAQYKAAATEFRRLRQSYPNYSPSAVQRNLAAVEGRIRELGGTLQSRQRPAQPQPQPQVQQSPAPAPEPPRTSTRPPNPPRAEVVRRPKPASQTQVDQTPEPEPEPEPTAVVRKSAPKPPSGRSAALAGAAAVIYSAPPASLREPIDLIRQATPRALGSPDPQEADDVRSSARPVDITVRSSRPDVREKPVGMADPAPASASQPGEGDLALRRQLVDEQKRVTQLENQIQRLQRQLRNADAQTSAGQAGTDEPQVTVQGDEQLIERIHNLRGAVADREERIVQLERELEFSRKGRSQQLEATVAEKEQLQEKVGQLQAHIAKLEDDDVTGAAEGKTGELLAATRKQLQEMRTERVELLRVNSSLREDVESLQQKIADLQGQIKTREIAQENAALAAAGGAGDSEETELLKQQLAEYKRRLESAREEKMQNLELIVALKEKLETVEDPAEQPANTQLAEMQEKVGKMGDLLTRARDKIAELQEQNKDLRGQLASAGSENSGADTQARQKLVADMEATRKRVEELLAQNTQLQETQDNLRKEVQQAQDQRKSVENLEQSLAQAEEKLSKIAEEKVGLEDKLAELENSRKTGSEDLANLKEANAQLRERLAVLESQPKPAVGSPEEATALFAENGEPAGESEPPQDSQAAAPAIAEQDQDQDPASTSTEDSEGGDSLQDAVNEAIAVAEQSVAGIEDEDAEAEQSEESDDATTLAENDIMPEDHEDLTEVDQAFDLKNPQGLSAALSGPLGAGTDPFDSVTGEDDALGGPLVSTSVPRPAGLSDDLANLAQEATDHFQSGRLEKAEEMFEKVVDKDPDNVYALSNLGVVRFKLQKFAEAEKVLKKAVEIDPKDAFSFETLGIVYFSQGKIDDAIEVLTMALNQDNTRWTAHNFLGIAASRKGWPEAAEKELRRAIELNPQYSDAHFNLAVLYATGQQPSLALAAKHYEKALSLGSSRSVELEQLLNRTDLAETGGAP